MTTTDRPPYYATGALAERIRDLAARVAAFDPDDRVPRPLIEPLSQLERWAEKHGNDEENRSCLDRIEAHAASNEETYRGMMFFLDGWSRSDNDDRREQAEERVRESPLSVVQNGDTVKIEESTGGPADGYEIEIDTQTGKLYSAEYYFRDWWDGATIEIEQRDYPATWRYLEYWASAGAEGILRREDDDE